MNVLNRSKDIKLGWESAWIKMAQMRSGVISLEKHNL